MDMGLEERTVVPSMDGSAIESHTNLFALEVQLLSTFIH